MLVSDFKNCNKRYHVVMRVEVTPTTSGNPEALNTIQ